MLRAPKWPAAGLPPWHTGCEMNRSFTLNWPPLTHLARCCDPVLPSAPGRDPLHQVDIKTKWCLRVTCQKLWFLTTEQKAVLTKTKQTKKKYKNNINCCCLDSFIIIWAYRWNRVCSVSYTCTAKQVFTEGTGQQMVERTSKSRLVLVALCSVSG